MVEEVYGLVFKWAVKNLLHQKLDLQFERYYYTKRIVIMIPTKLQSCAYLFVFFYKKIKKNKSKFQEVGSLVTDNISVFCLEWIQLIFKK